MADPGKKEPVPQGDEPLSCPVVHPEAVEAARLIVQWFQNTPNLKKNSPESTRALTELLTAARRVASEVLTLETALHEHAYKLFSRPKPPKPPQVSQN